ncbi:DUF445 domain-containing protein [Paenibacillus protaetiae]|uniref:DUF445 domain-containing protein n=1 Tax=Paenibacillus protaetiae TaxID=2509456 RepID=UPI0013ED8DF6|nr:DUF445 domain-containing protein [Paenibacillus protaetiae]
MKSKKIAIISLIVMAAGFLATRWLTDSWWVNMLHTGFEAGLVGGLADWFAVTALFRHPMGIPIPHTSLLLKNRNKIVNSLISAMENELLNKKSITEKLKKLRLTDWLGSGAVRFAKQRSVRLAVIEAAEQAVRRIPEDKAAVWLQQAAAHYAGRMELQPLAAKLVQSAADEGWDEKALDHALGRLKAWALKRETEDMMGKLAMQKLDELRVGGFMGFALQAFIGFMSEEKLGSMLQGILLSTIRDLSREGSAMRTKLLASVRGELQKLAGNDELIVRLQEWLRSKAESPAMLRFLEERAADGKAMLLAKLDEQRSNGGRIVVQGLRYAVELAKAHHEAVVRWEHHILEFAAHQIEVNHYRLGLLVRENLDKLDDQSLVNMLEEKIGGDLQWIRVNGAICGFLVGIVLSFI